MKKTIVISLGGSQIIPNDINIKFLREFKKIIKSNTSKYKFIIVCGGGSIARKYIYALREEKISEKLQSFSGISATRMNARFMAYFFNQDSEEGIPTTMKEVQNYLKKQDIIFCGALEYKPHQTSDSTSAQIASKLKTIFINITDVPGLHDKNPKTHKDAKFIKFISWKDFYIMVKKVPFKPGQHFVLDQTAAKIILKHKIPTYIIGSNKALDNFLNYKPFTGSVIRG